MTVAPPLREQYFERRQIREAIAFAEAGGIAVHRNFDHYHGSMIRGMLRERPFAEAGALATERYPAPAFAGAVKITSKLSPAPNDRVFVS